MVVRAVEEEEVREEEGDQVRRLASATTVVSMAIGLGIVLSGI